MWKTSALCFFSVVLGRTLIMFCDQQHPCSGPQVPRRPSLEGLGRLGRKGRHAPDSVRSRQRSPDGLVSDGHALVDECGRPAWTGVGYQGTLRRGCVRLPDCVGRQPHDHRKLILSERWAKNLFLHESDVCSLAQNMSTAHSIARFIDEDAREALTQPIQAQL